MTILDYNGTTLFTFFAVNGAGNGNAATFTCMWHQRKHRQVRSGCLKIALVHIKCVCTESKINFTTDSAVMHMATPTMTPMDYTNQGQDISSTISEI